MLNKIGFDEFKSIQLSIMDQIHSFCIENDIRYSLAFGTLIGAVRHKGYIPWDDDIDIVMRRDDYERFASSFHADNCQLLDTRKSEVCIESIIKVVRTNTIVKSPLHGGVLWGVFVDVFPIDGIPSDYKDYCLRIQSLRLRQRVVCPFYRVVGKNRTWWFIKYLIKRMMHPKLPSILNIKESIDAMLSSHKIENSCYAGMVISGDTNAPVPPQVFEEFISLPFEGREYMAVKNYDLWLTRLFGDYMTPPPEEQRVPGHFGECFMIQ